MQEKLPRHSAVETSLVASTTPYQPGKEAEGFLFADQIPFEQAQADVQTLIAEFEALKDSSDRSRLIGLTRALSRRSHGLLWLASAGEGGFVNMPDQGGRLIWREPILHFFDYDGNFQALILVLGKAVYDAWHAAMERVQRVSSAITKKGFIGAHRDQQMSVLDGESVRNMAREIGYDMVELDYAGQRVEVYFSVVADGEGDSRKLSSVHVLAVRQEDDKWVSDGMGGSIWHSYPVSGDKAVLYEAPEVVQKAWVKLWKGLDDRKFRGEDAELDPRILASQDGGTPINVVCRVKGQEKEYEVFFFLPDAGTGASVEYLTFARGRGGEWRKRSDKPIRTSVSPAREGFALRNVPRHVRIAWGKLMSKWRVGGGERIEQIIGDGRGRFEEVGLGADGARLMRQVEGAAGDLEEI